MPVKFSIHQGMMSGQQELQIRTYYQYKGKSGRRWYVAHQLDAASNVYVSDPNPKSQGFGGATLTFKLVSGEEVKEQGPWHSNADSLFEDTGIDVRDRYLTKGIVARSKIPSYPHEFFIGILHMDTVPVLGEYNRIDNIAQEWANQLQETIYYARVSRGGGISSNCKPQQETKK